MLKTITRNHILRSEILLSHLHLQPVVSKSMELISHWPQIKSVQILIQCWLNILHWPHIRNFDSFMEMGKSILEIQSSTISNVWMVQKRFKCSYSPYWQASFGMCSYLKVTLLEIWSVKCHITSPSVLKKNWGSLICTNYIATQFGQKYWDTVYIEKLQ